MRPAIAIFAFNRPQSLKRLLTSLDACPEFATAAVSVFVDGPRNPSEAARVAETLEVARAAARPDWAIVAQETNQGLKASIHGGVSQVTESHGHAIVLEDDLVVSPVALTYFIEALEHYEHEDRVWSICGYTYAHPVLERENRAFFVPFVHPWGWATWRRAWKRFSLDAPPLPRSLLKSRSFRRFFDVNRLTEATLLIDLEQRGLVSSWFIQWHRTVFLAGGLSLFPSRPLVMNRGVTIGGTHAGPLNPYPLLVRAPVLETDRPPELPTAVTPDFPAMDLMASGRDARMQRFVAVGGKFKRLLKRWLLGPR